MRINLENSVFCGDQCSKHSPVIFVRIVVGTHDHSIGKLTARKSLLSFGAICRGGELNIDFANAGNLDSLDRTRYLHAADIT